MVLTLERPWPPDQRSSTAAGRSEKIVISSYEGERVVELGQKPSRALRPFFNTEEKAPWQFYRIQETSAEGALKVKLSVEALLHSIGLILDREKAGPPVGSSFPAVDGENISVADARSRA